jgi:tryptophan synthase alpha chain
MNRIKSLFEEKKSSVLSVFYTAGFPKLNDTASIATLLDESGVDMIEIGIPFSDPIADGPVIQQSNKVALSNGMNVKLLLEQVKEARRIVKTPILLMGYLNPVIQYGVEGFCKDASESGVDGLILPDMPIREYQNEYKKYFDQFNLSVVFLISPTTSEVRILEIDKMSNAFIYAVSSSSTTGMKDDFDESQEAYFRRLQSLKLSNPFLVGFGISSHKTFSKVNKYAAGAIVGSAFIKMVQQTNDLKSGINDFVRSIRDNQI